MDRLGPLRLGDLGDHPQQTPASPGSGAARRQRGRGGSERWVEAGARVLGDLVEEIVLLFRRLRAAAEGLHGQSKLSGGRRNVLRELERLGPQTVPQLARARSVTRQHVQTLVNPLAEQGYVELIDNPAHKRSRLVRLSGAGKRYVEEMNRREAHLLGRLHSGLTESEVEVALGVLREVRRALEKESGRGHPKRGTGVLMERSRTESGNGTDGVGQGAVRETQRNINGAQL